MSDAYRPVRALAARALFVSFVLCGGLVAAAQGQSTRFDVTGVVADTSGAGLSGATVVVMRRADSTLVSFGVTRADGAFRIGRVPAGDYLLQTTFVGFAPHTQPLVVGDGPVDVGTIRLAEAVAALGELVVGAEHVPMVVRRDTLEYNAAAFGVRPGASVEDLLRRLPGIEVERDGTIKAQGETVDKVLVDGKEFFGNAPTVATRNLPADAVDRVQVYDDLSDAAEFTGVDDGESERTINLALKADRRQGYFGNATGGVGDGRRYEGRASINRFSPATQLSFIGNVNNVNQQGYSLGEYASFVGGLQNLFAGGRASLADAPISNDVGTGFSTTLSGGLNFNHDFGARTSLRSSYLAYYLDHDQDRTLLQHQLAGAAAAALSNQRVDQSSQHLSHRLNFNLRHAFAEGHDVQVRSNLQASGTDLGSRSLRETRSGGALENTSETGYATTNDALAGDASVTYRKRFAPGRTAVAELRAGLNDGDVSGELAALNRFYEEGAVLSSEEIAQLQAQRSHTLTHTQRLSYTEPLGRRQLLQFDLEHRAVLEDQSKTVSDLVAGLPVRNDVLSSAFDRTYRYLRGGATFRRAVEPLTLRAGLDVQQARLDGTIRGAAGVDRSFIRLLPSAAVEYAFSGGKNLELRYEAVTREPSMRDLQPFEDNTDPLNVYVGNPDLRPEYTHRADLRFTLFDSFTFTNLFAFVRASYTDARIVRVRTIDEQLRQRLTNTNADGDWTVSGNVSFGTPVRPLGLKVNLSTHTMYNRGVEYVNGAENAARILRSAWDLRLENRDKDVVDALAGARLTFNDVRYSLNPALDRAYVNRTFYGELTYHFAAGWRATTALDYNLYADDVSGSGRSVPLWRAELARTVMNDRAEVRLVARDLLDRNVGVSYTNASTYVQEEHVDTLGRYVMLQFVYNLSGVRRSGGGIQIQRVGP